MSWKHTSKQTIPLKVTSCSPLYIQLVFHKLITKGNHTSKELYLFYYKLCNVSNMNQ